MLYGSWVSKQLPFAWGCFCFFKHPEEWWWNGNVFSDGVSKLLYPEFDGLFQLLPNIEESWLSWMASSFMLPLEQGIESIHVFFFEGTPWQDFFSIPQVANPWSPDIWRSQTLRRWSQDMTMNFHICPDDCGHSICQKNIFIPIHTCSYIFRYGSLNWNTSHQNNICYLLFGFRRAQRPSAGSRPLKTSKCTWWPLISIVHAPSSSSGRATELGWSNWSDPSWCRTMVLECSFKSNRL
jgi:hypothetical protein